MRFAAAALTLALMLAGCTTSPLQPSARADGQGEPASASFSQFSDVPVPTKATMDVDRSLLLGNGDTWVGRLVYSSWSPAPSLYDFYRAQMPGFGWQEITSVRATISVQTWQRVDRVATIQIRNLTLGEAEVILTMTPANTANGAGGAMNSAAPPPPAPAGMPAKVSHQPLNR